MRMSVVLGGLGLVVLCSSLVAHAQSIKIARVTPYEDQKKVNTAVIDECKDLGKKLSDFTKEYAAENGLTVVQEDAIDPKQGGRVFVIQITNVVSSGNAFIGHRKSMSAQGELFENGVSKGVVNYTRDSMGGFAGGYKSSCAVLGRCTKALGKDLATWLEKHP